MNFIEVASGVENWGSREAASSIRFSRSVEEGVEVKISEEI